jgi:proteic killer suppression protein
MRFLRVGWYQMIRSFKDKTTEAVYGGQQPKRFPADLFQRVRNKLLMVDAATSLDDLKVLPGNKLHALTDDRKGQHAISINDQWRVCFVWRDGGAYDVEITDYH